MPTFKLSCGHTYYSSFKHHGHYLYCQKCQKELAIIGEWKIKCRDCRYARNFGTAHFNAQLAIDKHYIKTNHRMYLLYNGRVIERIQRVNMPGQLPFPDGVDPPF